MYARVVTVQISPEKVDEAIQLWRASVAPSVKQQHGFKSARLLVERKTGKIRSLGLWETEADLQGTVEWNQGQLAKINGPRPSEYLHIAETLGDWAVLGVGLEVESALEKNQAKKKGKQKPETVLRQVLGQSPGEEPQYGSLTDRPGMKSVKVKPGEDPFQVLLRMERESKKNANRL